MITSEQWILNFVCSFCIVYMYEKGIEIGYFSNYIIRRTQFADLSNDKSLSILYNFGRRKIERNNEVFSKLENFISKFWWVIQFFHIYHPRNWSDLYYIIIIIIFLVTPALWYIHTHQTIIFWTKFEILYKKKLFLHIHSFIHPIKFNPSIPSQSNSHWNDSSEDTLRMSYVRTHIIGYREIQIRSIE